MVYGIICIKKCLGSDAVPITIQSFNGAVQQPSIERIVTLLLQLGFHVTVFTIW